MSEKDELQKMKEFYGVWARWLMLRQQNKTLGSYFKEEGYKTVAIFGIKELGERLYYELMSDHIEVKYFIDNNPENICTDLYIYTSNDELPKVDVIVVTAIHYYEEIQKELKSKVSCPIVSLKTILNYII